MEKIEINIPGNPVALKRHRTFTSKAGNNINVDPSKSDKQAMLWKAIISSKPKKPLEGQLKITCIFYMPRPKSHFGTGKNSGVVKPRSPKFHTSKPDIDNLVKMIDAFNGVYWIDDAQISTLVARKVYADGLPKTIIKIERDSFINNK